MAMRRLIARRTVIAPTARSATTSLRFLATDSKDKKGGAAKDGDKKAAAPAAAPPAAAPAAAAPAAAAPAAAEAPAEEKKRVKSVRARPPQLPAGAFGRAASITSAVSRDAARAHAVGKPPLAEHPALQFLGKAKTARPVAEQPKPAPTSDNRKFRLVSAVVVERVPITNEVPSQTEVEWKAALADLRSRAYPRETVIELKAKKKVEVADEQEAVEGSEPGSAAQIERDAALIAAELLVPRQTDADRTNDRKSLQRRLSDKLYLIVKKDRKDHAWQFPQGGWEEEDQFSLRRTAERELTEECGQDLRVHWTTNQPAAHMTYNFTSVKTRIKYRRARGAKVFFFKALYMDGDVSLNTKELVDYAWVARDELKEYFSPKLLRMALKLTDAR